MEVFGLVGWSGSGKTTLMVQLLPELIGRGLRVSTVKHTHHNFDIDKKGKDSYQHRVAGAAEVLLASSKRWALLHEVRDASEPDMDTLIAHMTPVDLVLVEGFKKYHHAKLEVFRPSVGQAPLWPDDPTVVAVATDEAMAEVRVPVLDLNNVAAVADFIVEHCGLRETVNNGVA
jgi:molybdopterin-guanine dinucleotide biosynthesis protein B